MGSSGRLSVYGTFVNEYYASKAFPREKGKQQMGIFGLVNDSQPSKWADTISYIVEYYDWRLLLNDLTVSNQLSFC